MPQQARLVPDRILNCTGRETIFPKHVAVVGSNVFIQVSEAGKENLFAKQTNQGSGRSGRRFIAKVGGSEPHPPNPQSSHLTVPHALLPRATLVVTQHICVKTSQRNACKRHLNAGPDLIVGPSSSTLHPPCVLHSVGRVNRLPPLPVPTDEDERHHGVRGTARDLEKGGG